MKYVRVASKQTLSSLSTLASADGRSVEPGDSEEGNGCEEPALSLANDISTGF